MVLGLGAIGVLMLACLALQERRAADPILPPRLFGNRTFLCGVLIAFFTSLGLFGATFLLPLYFQLVLGFGAETSGLFVMPFLASTVVGAFAGGQLARRVGRTKGLILAGLAGKAKSLGVAVLDFDGDRIREAGLQGRCRESNWKRRMSSQASLQAPVLPGKANR